MLWRRILIGGAILFCLASAGCNPELVRADAERVAKAEGIRCRYSQEDEGRPQDRLLAPSTALEIKCTLAEAITPSRYVIPRTKGCIFALLEVEGPEGKADVQIFCNPLWAEVDFKRYYRLTKPELETIKRALETKASPQVYSQSSR